MAEPALGISVECAMNDPLADLLEVKTQTPVRHYFVTVCPANVHVLDEGMALKILLPAANPRQARRRVRRYAPGRIQAVQLVRWTER
jgi:hypothetical protein